MKIPVGMNRNINGYYTDKCAHITNDSTLTSALSAIGAYDVAPSVVGSILAL